MNKEILQAKNRYIVKTPLFEGPFNLLLSLVEKKKLFINDLSLAKVTESYLEHLNNIPEDKKDELGSFIVVAATLMLIKSKSLLPDLNLTQEEESDISKLEARLKLFEIFSKLGLDLSQSAAGKTLWRAKERKIKNIIFLPDEQITKESMMALAKEIILKAPKKTFIQEVKMEKSISLEDMIKDLSSRIQKTLKMSFRDFTGKNNTKTKKEKVFVIISFLAMLELVRTGDLTVTQKERFEDITIEK